MPPTLEQNLAAVGSIRAIPTILDIVCRTTGMGFAAVTRVTEDRWIACSVHDKIDFGLAPAASCRSRRRSATRSGRAARPSSSINVAGTTFIAVIPRPSLWLSELYLRADRLGDGTFFGTLCAIDPPRRLKTGPRSCGMFEMFADCIGVHLDARSTVSHSIESDLVRRTERLGAARTIHRRAGPRPAQSSDGDPQRCRRAGQDAVE